MLRVVPDGRVRGAGGRGAAAAAGADAAEAAASPGPLRQSTAAAPYFSFAPRDRCCLSFPPRPPSPRLYHTNSPLPRYDAADPAHRLIKKQIEEGDGLPDMARCGDVDAAIENVGFEIIETRDAALDANPGGKPWYLPLTPSWNVLTQRFQFTALGMWLTTNILWVMEKCCLAPKGTSKVQTMLQQGGVGCANGGLTGTFTPMYLVVCRKPNVRRSKRVSTPGK